MFYLTLQYCSIFLNLKTWHKFEAPDKCHVFLVTTLHNNLELYIESDFVLVPERFDFWWNKNYTVITIYVRFPILPVSVCRCLFIQSEDYFFIAFNIYYSSWRSGFEPRLWSGCICKWRSFRPNSDSKYSARTYTDMEYSDNCKWKITITKREHWNWVACKPWRCRVIANLSIKHKIIVEKSNWLCSS